MSRVRAIARRTRATRPAIARSFAVAILCAVLVACGNAITPRSAPVPDRTSEYPHELHHCGVGSLVDFDGSLWRAVGVVPEPAILGGIAGTIQLVGDKRAVFRSTNPRFEFELERTPSLPQFVPDCV